MMGGKINNISKKGVERKVVNEREESIVKERGKKKKQKK
jgi:hypothetical protein